MGKPAAEFLLPVPLACSGDTQLFFHFYVLSHTLLNVSHLNHLCKISTGITQKGDSGLHCEERQLLITDIRAGPQGSTTIATRAEQLHNFAGFHRSHENSGCCLWHFSFESIESTLIMCFAKEKRCTWKCKYWASSHMGTRAPPWACPEPRATASMAASCWGHLARAVLCALGCSCAGAKQAGAEALWPLLG